LFPGNRCPEALILVLFCSKRHADETNSSAHYRSGCANLTFFAWTLNGTENAA